MSTDIRKGDLVRATSNQHPDVNFQGRVTDVSERYVSTAVFGGGFHAWDFEVLDRPLPPISEELLVEATGVYRDAMGFSDRGAYHNRVGIRAVINYLRENDTYNKENA